MATARPAARGVGSRSRSPSRWSCAADFVIERSRCDHDDHMRLLFGLVGVALMTASVAAAPAIDLGASPFGGSGVLTDGGFPAEQQFGLIIVRNSGTTPLTVTEIKFTGAGA